MPNPLHPSIDSAAAAAAPVPARDSHPSRRPSIEQVIKELTREKHVRFHFYKKLVFHGKLTQEVANFRLACLTESIRICTHYKRKPQLTFL